MPAVTSQSGEPSLQRQLIDKLRFILAIIATMASLFALDELLTADYALGALFAFRVSGALLSLLGFFVLRGAWAEPWARPLTIGIVVLAYLVVAAAGMTS